MTLKIFVTRRWPAAVEAVLQQRHGATLNHTDLPLQRAALSQALRDYDVLCTTITDKIDRDLLRQSERRTRLLCNYGAGLDHIDLEAAHAAGVRVTNTPDALTDATAEIAITLMLMVARRVSEGQQEVQSNSWEGWRPTHLLGRQLTGKTLGLVGFGRIGQRTAEIAAALGMRTIYHSRNRVSGDLEARLAASHRASLGALLERADVVSLHCPGGVETDGLMNTERLRQMRSGAILINTARGSIIDERALAEALTSKRIAGAGLDVFRNEPTLSPELRGAPNLVVLPHLGSATDEARTAMGMQAVSNLEHWLAGERPPNLIGED